MTKLTFIFLALLIATVAMADNELKLKAMSEAEAPRETRKTATDVSMTGQNADGILSLKDPTPDFKNRSYDWVLGLKVQNFQPSGDIESNYTRTTRLDNLAAYNLPSLELGLRFKTSSPQWHWGILGHAGYNSQKLNVVYTDKTTDPEGQLNTLLTDGGLNLDYDPLSYLGAHAALGVGVINYSQSGASSYAKITEDATFRFWTLGAHTNIGPHWQVLLSYMNRTLLNPGASNVDLPTGSAELGTRFLW